MEFYQNNRPGRSKQAMVSCFLAALFLLCSTLFVKLVAGAKLFVSPGASGSTCTRADPCALQDALDLAENNSAADTIYLAPGTYAGNFEYRPPDSESYSLEITGVSGTTAEDVILDGQNKGRVLGLFYYPYYSVPAFDVCIKGITIENGDSTLESHRNGGGISIGVFDANVFITSCIIKNNTAEEEGGGIWVNPTRAFYLENNLVVDNIVNESFAHISRGAGAFLMIPGGFNNVIRNNVFARNTALGSSSEGGGLFMGWSGTCTQHVFGNTIYNNHAYDGGGIYFYNASTANVYNNNYSTMHGTWTESGNNQDIDPKLRDPESNDFHLQMNSPMIDAGTDTVPDPPGLPATDFEGNTRAFGAAPDIGADERLCVLAPSLDLLLLGN
ncbi:MAG: hypothetical protein JRI89_09575 [Deltaproteobacteria bacterium]|nr:hypothetical protein [Deltaproteobacteria bacterium]